MFLHNSEHPSWDWQENRTCAPDLPQELHFLQVCSLTQTSWGLQLFVVCRAIRLAGC